MRQGAQPGGVVVAVHLVRCRAAIGDDAAQADVVVLRLRLDGGDDAVHGEDAVEVVCGDDQRPVGMLQRGREAAAHHIPQYVEDHHVGFFQQVMLLQQLHRLAHHVAAAARAGRRSARLHAHHAVKARVDEVLDPQLLRVEVHRLQHIDDGRQQLLGERESGVVLRVAADLQHALAELAERDRQVGGGGAFADTALAVDGEDFGRAYFDGRVHLNLDAALAIAADRPPDRVG